MKKVMIVILSLVFVLSFSAVAAEKRVAKTTRKPAALDSTSSMNDRHCGKVMVVTWTPSASCPTCTPMPSQYYLQVTTRFLAHDTDASGNYIGGNNSTIDHPTQLLMKLGNMRECMGDTNIEVCGLQDSVNQYLTTGAQVCAVGRWGTLQFADDKASQGIDFYRVYPGQQ
jgi:hypothetical protein